MKFEKTAELKNANLVMKFSGLIGEGADFGNYEFDKINSLIIDFSDVKLINSVGISVWVKWFYLAQTKNAKLNIHFLRCPKVLVDQFNNIPSFLPKNTLVRSFAVPMSCESCSSEIGLTLLEGKDYILNKTTNVYDIKLPNANCPTCGAPMTTDINAKRYFSFLKP